MYKRIDDNVDNIKNEIIDIAKYIHKNPEIRFTEYKACKYLSEALADKGFKVKVGVGGLDTSFRAEYGSFENKDFKVAILAEYDALPEIGHACGHNLIAAAAYGAGVALSEICEENSFGVVVIGTPAEEGGGGKITLLENGVFDDIDYALMIHPSDKNMVGRGGRANARFTLEYHGLACHSARPDKGINALSALVETIGVIDNQRHLYPDKSTLNYIITNGGVADNIIPDYASCRYSVRGTTLSDVELIGERIKDIVKGIEIISGAKGILDYKLGYAERYPNKTMGGIFRKHLEELGETFKEPPGNGLTGSSDIGNVSLTMPIIHAYVDIDKSNKGIKSHNKSFTEACNTQEAFDITIKASKALAKTVLDIQSDANLRKLIYNEFEATVPK